MSRPYAEVIGDPIAHSKSPPIHNFWLGKLGIDAEYRACHVRPDELADYFARRRGDAAWRGCNVTIPHKVAVMVHIGAIEETAERVGAVNTVVREQAGLAGYNTDVAGFLEPLLGETYYGITVIGAGGAARAVLAGLLRLSGAFVSIKNRDVEKAKGLLAEFGLNGCAVGLEDEVPTADLLVNASSLGMVGQPELPHVLSYVTRKATVVDLVYAPLETRLLARARERNLRTFDGLHMLVGQAAAAFEKFFGQPAPRQHDAELRALLTP